MPFCAVNVVKVMGREVALDLYNDTREIESEGGIIMKNQRERLASGGVFLTLLKEKNPSREQDAAIFPHDKKRQKAFRKQKEHKLSIKYPRKAIARMDADAVKDLEAYLRNMLLHSFFRSHRDVLELLEVSCVSFVPGYGMKLKEGMVKKRSGGYTLTGGLASLMPACFLCPGFHVNKRWLVLKESCLFFVQPKTGQVRGVLLMDWDFQVRCVFEKKNMFFFSRLIYLKKIKVFIFFVQSIVMLSI